MLNIRAQAIEKYNYDLPRLKNFDLLGLQLGSFRYPEATETQIGSLGLHCPPIRLLRELAQREATGGNRTTWIVRREHYNIS